MRRRRLIFRGGTGAAIGAALWLASFGAAAAQTPEPSVPGIDQIPGSDLIPQPTLEPSSNQVAPGSVLPPGTDPTGLVQGGNDRPGSTSTSPEGSNPGGSGPSGPATGGAPDPPSGGASGTLRDPSVATRIGGPLRQFQDTDDSLGAVAERAFKLAVPLAAPIGVAALGVIGLFMMAKGTARLESLESEREALDGRTVIRL